MWRLDIHELLRTMRSEVHRDSDDHVTPDNLFITIDDAGADSAYTHGRKLDARYLKRMLKKYWGSSLFLFVVRFMYDLFHLLGDFWS